MRFAHWFTLALVLGMTAPALAQSIITGRAIMPVKPGSDQTIPMTAMHVFTTPRGSLMQGNGFRTWETHPAGWYFLPGIEGDYTAVFSDPGQFYRPVIRTNMFTDAGDKVDGPVTSPFDYAVFDNSAWDEKAATDYYQTFVAKGTSVTQVGFQVVHDGVDGGAAGGQNLMLAIHEVGDGKPDTWKQIGPARVVLGVDSGGPKNYKWSAGWDSGQVPITPGKTYAVHLYAEKEGSTFQAWWSKDESLDTKVYRIGDLGPTGWQKRNLWMAVSTDCNGLLIPYNKCTHRKFGELTRGTTKWSQTYVAQGRSLASAMMYAAVDGTQPPLAKQRCIVRVRKGGPSGPIVGTPKIAIGNGNYTGDASWGMFGLAFAPGEVPLTPGETYAIEFETIENTETLKGWIDIKGRHSTNVPGFTPYRKHAPDDYAHGTAYFEGTEAMDYDLDMQIIEYQHFVPDWDLALHEENLLTNGDMQAGDLKPDAPEEGEAMGWTPFKIDPQTSHQYLTDQVETDNRMIRVIGGGINNSTVDGGFVQKVEGLSQLENYVVTGKVRSSWPVDEKHACWVGVDMTGQTRDPEAETITWTTMPGVHGIFCDYRSRPDRPEDEAISIWLRAQTTQTDGWPFRVDFDDFALRQVRTHPPMK